ncbi:MAG: hypothetical protein QXU45_02490 [Candidatus Bathyarchaeia archaeon]
MSLAEKLAAYRAQIELSNKEGEIIKEIKALQESFQLLSEIFWKLKFLIHLNFLDDHLKGDLISKVKTFKQQKQIQAIYNVQFQLEEICSEMIHKSGKDLDVLLEGARLLGIECQKLEWIRKIKSIKNEETYKDMVELYDAIAKQKSILIDVMDKKLRLKKARELFLKILREGEVKLSEFNLKQLEEILKSPLREYISIKLSGKQYVR